MMIGVDAAELSMIHACIHQLPNFQKLLGEAVLLPLQSTAEYIPASVWPTMYTGKSPGDHAISQHIQWDPSTMRMRRITSNWVYSEPFWYDLRRAGLNVTVLDVPFLFENHLPEAVEVINWGSHDLMGKFDANPERLRSEIRKRFGSHAMGYEIPVSKDTTQLETMKKECIAGAKTKGELARWLCDQTEWDFFLAVFGECHRAGHILWRDHDAVHDHVPKGALLEVYQAVDAAVGSLLEGVDMETTSVVIFSLHGMGHNFSQEHIVRRTMDRINATFLGEPNPHTDSTRGANDGHGGPPHAKTQRGFIRALRESIPASVQHAVARSVPVSIRDWVVAHEVAGGVDWKKTPGFPLRSDLFSFLRLNIIGREKLGLLEMDSTDYHRYIDHVTHNFLALRSAKTNAPIVRDLLSLHKIFPGSRQDLLPDLLVRWVDSEYPVSEVRSPDLGLIHGAPDSGRTGEHRPDGFALVLGAAIKQGALPPLSHNSHFPHFVSHLLGLSIPS